MPAIPARRNKEIYMYFVSYSNTSPVATRAKTLAGAKRAAARHCIFQGQDEFVFTGSDADNLTLVAARYNDPIDMSARGKWQDVGVEEAFA
jgi:hypothetical protein